MPVLRTLPTGGGGTKEAGWQVPQRQESARVRK